MDVKNRIRELAESRGWTYYRLAKESGVSWSTIRNMFDRNTEPTVPTLEALCRGLGITLVDLLLSDDIPDLTSDQRELITNWNNLSEDDKKIVLALVRSMSKKNPE